MRFSILFALLVATFAVCLTSFANAEQNDLRRLKSGDIKLTGWFSDAATEEERDTSSLVLKLVNKLKKGTAAQKAAGRAAGVAAKNTAINQKQVESVGKAVATAAKKEPKKWSTLKKVIVGTLGVAAATAVITVAYNMLKGNSSSTAATSTATAGSL